MAKYTYGFRRTEQFTFSKRSRFKHGEKDATAHNSRQNLTSKTQIFFNIHTFSMVLWEPESS